MSYVSEPRDETSEYTTPRAQDTVFCMHSINTISGLFIALFMCLLRFLLLCVISVRMLPILSS